MDQIELLRSSGQACIFFAGLKSQVLAYFNSRVPGMSSKQRIRAQVS
jgi:hypothetical protein